MKKILILFVLIIIILVGLYFAAPTLRDVEPISEPVGAYEDFINGLIGKEKVIEDDEEEPIVEAEPVEEIEEEPEEEVLDEIIEEEPEEEAEEPSGPAPRIIDLSFYSDDRINFTYPEEFQIVDVSELTFEMQTKEGNLLATFDLLVNDSNLTLAEFLQQDNVVDYLGEAERVSINPEELLVGEESVYLKDFPGFITQDVYLVRIPGFVLLVQARNQKELIRRYVVPTLEAK